MPADTDALAREVFERYDIDRNGALSIDELAAALTDLCELRRGHRNVPPEVISTMRDEIEAKHGGELRFDAWCEYVRRFGVDVWWEEEDADEAAPGGAIGALEA